MAYSHKDRYKRLKALQISYEYANGITDEMMIWRMREQDRMVLRDYMDDIRATARAIEVAADRLAGGKK